MRHLTVWKLLSALKQAGRSAAYRKGAVVQVRKQSSIPALENLSGKDQDTRTARHNLRCFWKAQRGQDRT